MCTSTPQSHASHCSGSRAACKDLNSALAVCLPAHAQVAMLFPATKNATGSYDISLDLPSPEGAGLWQALCAGAIIVSGIDLVYMCVVCWAIMVNGTDLLYAWEGQLTHTIQLTLCTCVFVWHPPLLRQSGWKTFGNILSLSAVSIRHFMQQQHIGDFLCCSVSVLWTMWNLSCKAVLSSAAFGSDLNVPQVLCLHLSLKGTHYEFPMSIKIALFLYLCLYLYL